MEVQSEQSNQGQKKIEIFIETVVQDSELDHLACYLNEENKNVCTLQLSKRRFSLEIYYFPILILARTALKIHYLKYYAT